MEQLFDDFLGDSTQQASSRGAMLAPRMDVSEDEHEIHVCAEMPGTAPDKVSVTLDDDVLTIRGEREQDRGTPVHATTTWSSAAGACSSARCVCRLPWIRTRSRHVSSTAC
jgi:HSP20 family molecular chaperone IbpA